MTHYITLHYLSQLLLQMLPLSITKILKKKWFIIFDSLSIFNTKIHTYSCLAASPSTARDARRGAASAARGALAICSQLITV